jgi:hypothetical protein
VTGLAHELAQIAADPADLRSTRQTLIKLTHDEVTSLEPAIISESLLVRASPSARQGATAPGAMQN